MDQSTGTPADPVASPLLPRAKRRWFRFSLRTLLLFVLLIGSSMGLWFRWEPWVCESGPARQWIDLNAFDDETLVAPDGTRTVRREESSSSDWRILVCGGSDRRALCELRHPSGSRMQQPLGFLDNETFVMLVDGSRWWPGHPYVYHRRRPEYWWGLAWLPEFWLTLLFAPAFLGSVWRDRKTL